MITMNSQLSFTSVHALLCSIFIGLINIPQCQSVSSLYANCSTIFSCGGVNVSYPFWGENRAYGCGYHKLKITCETGVAKIDIANVKYRLLDYCPDTQIMAIARDDYASGLCSPNYTNTTLEPELFELIANHINSSLVYGCPPNAFTKFLGQFSCSVNGTSNTDGYLIEGAVGPGTCFASVTVPYVHRIDGGNHSSSIDSDLQGGFGVRLKVDKASCDACIESKGVCGFDHYAHQRTCYCENGTSGSEKCSFPTFAEAPHGQPTNGMSPTNAEAPQGQPAKGMSPINAEALKGHCTNGIFIGSELRKWLTISTVCATTVVIATILTIWLHRRQRSSFHVDNCNNVEMVINRHGFLGPRRYRYFELKKITNSFTEKIGQGGYGTVYKGKLLDGRLVAVKLLIESKADGEEFINEVVSISRTSHVNVVSLLGFCYEKSKRAIIYEFLSNGSLDKYLPLEGALHASMKIDWKILHQIILGIAQGLEYLHRGCKTRILHFDIKPQNILLDQDFVPKISDFGLAKLCLGNESMVSLLGIRGTIGYIAPEVISRNFGRVSHKSDVYSYGMLVLAMVCGKSINNEQVSHSSDLYFPHNIYKQLEPGRDFKFKGVVTNEEEEIARKLIIISLWCIQTNPSTRPSITEVIDMLEGSLHSMNVPPEPFLTDPLSQHQNLVMAPHSNSYSENDDEEESIFIGG